MQLISDLLSESVQNSHALYAFDCENDEEYLAVGGEIRSSDSENWLFGRNPVKDS